MPNNWKTYKLKEIGNVITGNTPSSKYPEDFGDDIAFVTPSDFSNYHKTINNSKRYLSNTGSKRLKSKYLPIDSIIVTCIGSDMGKVAMNKVPCITNQQINSIIVNETFSADYLYYSLISKYDYLRLLAGDGTTMPIINKGRFEEIEIKLPPIQEQKSIAQILSTIDDKIENNFAINKTLEEMAMALYKHWFVDFGPFQEGEFVDSELGKIPKGWEVKKITDLIEVKDGTHDSPKRVEDGFYLITSKHIMTNSIDFSSAYKISYDDYIKINKRSLVEKGDILMTMIGTVGNFYFVNEEPNYVIKNLGLFKTSKAPLLKIYLFSFFNSKIGQEYIKSQMTGSTQQYVTLKTLRDFDIIVPDKQILVDYNHLANEYFEKILINIKENQTLTQLRDTLLPKLISGEVRLKEFRESITN